MKSRVWTLIGRVTIPNEASEIVNLVCASAE
jgi:hypothetical protein